MSSEGPEIPVVDLHELVSPQSDRRSSAAQAVREGFGHYGLVYVRNHGVDMDLLDEFYESFLEFTGRSREEKEQLSGGDVWYQRGWTPPNTEQAVVAGQPDFKECYFISPEEPEERTRQKFPEIFAENIWPAGADTFRRSYLEISRELQQVGVSLLRGCAEALGLAPAAFEQRVDRGPHVTRALRYVPLDEEQVGTEILWGEEHTDFNAVTILPGGRFLDPAGDWAGKPDDDAGLYLRTRPTEEHPEGRKVQGDSPEGCIVAQVGQQLEVWTGGEFLATPHAIEAPGIPDWSRVSMAHFSHAHPESRLFPLEKFQSPETIAGYGPPVLAGTYNLKTLVDIGLAPESALDRLGYTQYSRLDELREQEDAAE